MLNIVCVQTGNYQGRGAEYVNTLLDMVRRNLAEGTQFRFWCLTGDATGLDPAIEIIREPGHLNGWWNKLWLFREGLFPRGERVLYFDLDTVITGSIDEVAACDSEFAILRDFYRPNGLQSSVMAWRVSENTEAVYDRYRAVKYPKLPGGDQEWIERCACFLSPCILQDLFPGAFVSYKEHARYGIPKGAKVVCFHGLPRPHECGDWVKHVWKIGGGTTAEFVVECNVSHETILANIRHAKTLKTSWLELRDPHDGVALVVAGGPSLTDSLPSVMAHKASGAAIVAVNGALAWLAGKNIEADYHVILDARPENAAFVCNCPATRIYSSQCDPSVAEQADTLFHPFFDGITDITGTDDQSAYIGGGTTAGLKAIVIAYALGYRRIHLYGFDSCYRDNDNHAYAQALNAAERIIDVHAGDKTFRCAPWMATQAEDFQSLAPDLIAKGCEICVHGEGLIPEIAAGMANNVTPADQRAFAILRRLNGHSPTQGAEIGVFAGDLSMRLLAGRSDLTLHMVDSWATEHEPDYAASGDFHATLDGATQDRFAEFTRQTTAFAGKRANIIRADSLEAAQAIPDGSLDFAFIDANHSYSGCKSDIDAWFPKIRNGGFISGHDYENEEFPKFGVKRAVDEFIAAHNLKLELDQNYTWFARKGE